MTHPLLRTLSRQLIARSVLLALAPMVVLAVAGGAALLALCLTGFAVFGSVEQVNTVIRNYRCVEPEYVP